MATSPTDKVPGKPLDAMVQTVSEQAAALARKEVELARRELSTKARKAAGGAAMLGGAALLGTLAAGTGTAGVVLLLSRRPGPSAAALGVAGAYAVGGAGLAQQGIARLRAAAPPVPEETVESVKAVKRPKKTTKTTKTTKKKPRPRRSS